MSRYALDILSFGYIEFYDEVSVPTAILMTGEKLLGIPIIVSYTETEKNRQAEEALLSRYPS